MAPPTTTTSKLALVLPAAGNPDYEPGNSQGLLASAVAAMEAALLGATKYTSAGAIAIGPGKAFLQAGSAAAMTLAAPTSGTHDGMEITIVALDAFAYTVTTPSNAINGSKHVATWTAAIGNSIKLIAYNGVWYSDETALGVALS
ncbi:MAG: hypothetical protein KGL39_18545 [Patescibacteria group bacterium]|nr:hypothetical protein [Patescibacteria group bacterium]